MTDSWGIRARLDDLRERTMYRHRRIIESPLSREVVVGGRRLLNFCSNDYLGLAGDARIAEAFSGATATWGVGAGASHLICGHTRAHHELEEALAEFTGRPRALLFSSGYMANMGAINGLLTSGDQVFEDRLNHASLLDGGWISRADFHWYEHGDARDLEKSLGGCASERRKLVVSDGTFSMDGDLCPLEDVVSVARQHGAWVLIDDAHGIGVHGRDGCGLVDARQFSTEDVPILVGTLGKALGTFGAFVAGSEDLVESLIQRARSYVFTTALPSAVAVATLASLRIARSESWRREKLANHVARFRRGADEVGLHLLPSSSPIQPVIVGDPAAAVSRSRALEERGLLVTAIRPPTVPEGTSRLRITFTAAHEESDVDRLLEALAEVCGRG
ncbi:MAG: 8-amino-7-oxononanoate synthase [Myxococcota bacterium]|nr:8-amino-7-oxononanoate synthase [Myxococcota bacterium]